MIYRVEVTYPNGNIEEIDEDFYTLKSAMEHIEHILGEVSYNKEFHADTFDIDGDEVHVQPYAIIKEVDENETKIVFDSRNQ